MYHNIENILILANMLSKTLGKFMQVTVSDTQAYLFAENVIGNEAVVGQAISDNEKYFLDDPDLKQLPFVVNYKSLSHEMNKLRSSTYFFKNEEGNIEYLLSLTTNVDEFVYVREILDVFTNGSLTPAIKSSEIDHIPKLNLSIHALIDTVISEGQKRYSTVVKRMTKMEKQSLIREMYSRGAFLIKGAVNEVATKLDYSEATIYRYLQKLEGK
ncbi:MAG: helix-turn-helix domain-containing protein [Clostridiales bacterium]|nr:helix-turn-helix domain-containing protein [Clostridiales bacterium]